MLVATNLMDPELQAKFFALCEFSGQPPSGVTTLCLEVGIIEMWDNYARNPKHSAQIKQWECDHAKAESDA